MTQITLDNIIIQITEKNIKYLRLKVFAPPGEVRISVPLHTPLSIIKAFITSKLEWIKRKQAAFEARPFIPKHDYVEGEIHRIWGKNHLCKLYKHPSPHIKVTHEELQLHLPLNTSYAKKKTLVEQFHKQLLQQAIPTLITYWEAIMGVKVNHFTLQTMKSRWGSCNIKTSIIKLNSELAKYAPIYLEYVVVHEMVHLLEPSHNYRFKSFMDQFLPEWRSYKQQLNTFSI